MAELLLANSSQDQLLESEKSAEEEDKTHFCKRIIKNYDGSFTSNLALLYINGGFKVLYSVALNPIYKVKYGLTST